MTIPEYVPEGVAVGFVLWFEGNQVKVLCGFHRALGVNMFGEPSGLSFGDLQNLDAEVYVVIPTIYAELDHRSCSLLRYETLETE